MHLMYKCSIVPFKLNYLLFDLCTKINVELYFNADDDEQLIFTFHFQRGEMH
jgi:hypothetical protein